MKISYNWLKTYISFDVPAEKLGELLTDCGLEVEGIETVETVEGGLKGLVVGEVMSCEQHPNADRLKKTLVNIGSENYLPIVCGAPNVAAGQKVVVATVGATLYPAPGESFKIKKSKIRGEVSEGMICAEDEIGLGISHEGIMVLDNSTAVGQEASVYFNLQSDYVFEIGLTPNRADAMSHFGVARDLVAVFNRFGIKHGGLKLPNVTSYKSLNQKPSIDFEVLNTEACPRYVGITIENVKVGSSPDWLQTRLKTIGLNPINNVVDVTNYVLHELGQPLHAFDADKIDGNKVVVKTLEDKTSFETLDEVKRELSEKDLMICNTSEGMCIAGVFGGIKSGVTENTSNIFLESAYFNPVSVRKTAKRHGLNTDASFRFERGIDPEITVYAAKRAAMLIQEVAGGELVSEPIDFYPNPIEGFKVGLNLSRLEQLAGKQIPINLVKSILKDLKIEIKGEAENTLQLYVPPFKVDVQREADVIEEVLRIYGFNEIENPAKMNISLVSNERPSPEKVKNMALNHLASNGFNEMMANSLTKANYYEENAGKVEILNPLSGDLGVMRKSMLYSGLEAVAYNQNRGESNLRLFEFGKTYHQYESGNVEHQELAIFLTGKPSAEGWIKPHSASGVFVLKGILESLMQRLGIKLTALKTKESGSTELDFGIELSLQKLKVATLGQVSTKLQSQFDIKQPVYYSIINWDNLFTLVKRQKTQFKPIPKYPVMRRDLALLVDSDVQFDALSNIAQQSERKLLKRVDIFDVYTGKGMPSGKKSYALSFEFRDENKTLTDQVVDKSIKRIYEQLNKQTGAELRSGEL
jgi:phenylalanyl-tRNA synthetase beta chain